MFPCPEHLKRGFHAGIFLFSFSTLGLPQGRFQPKIWPQSASNRFSPRSLIIIFFNFFFFIFSKIKAVLKNLVSLKLRQFQSHSLPY